MSKLIVRPAAVALAAALTLMPAAAKAEADLAAMLKEAQRFTVKVRGTVLWPFAPEQLGSGQGTGFIIDRAKGWILTNAHVARRSPSTVEIAVGDSEAEWIAVKRLFVDNYLDIAVLKVSPDKLPAEASAAKLGCTQTIKQGGTVVAYGHPINLSFTATRGIVSSVRTLGNQEFVQMDANINPGNSGGPLLAVDAAEVIGVNTANFPGAPGLGLATSIRHVCPILAFLNRGEDPSVPSLPVYWLKQGRVETLTVATRFPRAGEMLKPGDVLQGLAGGPKLAGLPDLHTALRGKKDRVTLTVLREGKPLDVEVPLIAPRPPLARVGLTVAGMLVTERVTLDTVDLGLPPLRIEFIKAGEEAQRAGFAAWDHIEAVGGEKFATVKALHDWIKTRPAGEKIRFLVRRGSLADPRVSAEYHRFDLAAGDVKLLTSNE